MVLFEDGIPARITKDDFKFSYLDHFPKFRHSKNDSIIERAISSVYTMFAGVGTIWDKSTPQTWYDKTRLCYIHLTAWYIADMYPMYVSGVPTMGGIPLKSKKMDSINITFADNAGSGNNLNLLSGLLSNPFGKQAYMMISTCAKRIALR